MLSSSGEIITDTFVGLSVSECLEKARKKYGDDNDFIRRENQKVKIGGFLGFGEKDGVKVTFIITPKKNAIPSFYRQNKSTGISNQSVDFEPRKIVAQKESLEEAKQKIIDNSGKKINVQMSEILDEIRELREVVETQQTEVMQEENPTIARLEKMLEHNEFTQSYSKGIIERVKKEFSLEELENFDVVQDAVVQWIGESISVKKAEYAARPQVVILVGPTGVGKTTTVAKLAARYVCPTDDRRAKKVGIITVDCFRVAAKQQIETYGNHMEIPVMDADSNEQLSQVLKNFQDDYDLILIDTIGYSPKDFRNIAAMRELLSIKNMAVETYLTFSASTKLSDMRDIMQQYEIFGYDSVILTKIDETNYVGNVISILNEKKKSIVYITTGQQVPRNFENANVLRFFDHIADFKIDREKLEQMFPMG